MNLDNVKYLACPATGEELKVKGNQLESNISSNRYEIRAGIPDFSYPKDLGELDKEFNSKYDASAVSYDEGMEWLFNSFFETEDHVREQLIAPLHLKEDYHVLNMGCGTGSDSFYIAKKLGKNAKLFNLDLSQNLLNIAQKKLHNHHDISDFFVGNGSYLPFKSNTFDAVFHFGGVNVFSEKQRAIEEMARVTKVGGRVVFGDEGVAPWLYDKEYGKILQTANPLYRHSPPLELIPGEAQGVSLKYVLGNAFYIIAFTVGAKPQLNLDLPIPGRRGGSLRSRYEAAKK